MATFVINCCTTSDGDSGSEGMGIAAVVALLPWNVGETSYFDLLCDSICSFVAEDSESVTGKLLKKGPGVDLTFPLAEPFLVLEGHFL